MTLLGKFYNDVTKSSIDPPTFPAQLKNFNVITNDKFTNFVPDSFS